MATPIREHCLDENDKPNKCAARVQKALDDAGGCAVLLASGPKKGARCGEKLVFLPANVEVVCESKLKDHREWAYEDRYSEIIFGVINTDTPDAEEVAEAKEADDVRAKKDAVERAGKEAEVLGIEAGGGHPRPEGKAPEGETWSYFYGEWVTEARLAKRQKTEKGEAGDRVKEVAGKAEEAAMEGVETSKDAVDVGADSTKDDAKEGEETSKDEAVKDEKEGAEKSKDGDEVKVGAEKSQDEAVKELEEVEDVEEVKDGEEVKEGAEESKDEAVNADDTVMEDAGMSKDAAEKTAAPTAATEVDLNVDRKETPEVKTPKLDAPKVETPEVKVVEAKATKTAGGVVEKADTAADENAPVVNSIAEGPQLGKTAAAQE